MDSTQIRKVAEKVGVAPSELRVAVEEVRPEKLQECWMFVQKIEQQPASGYWVLATNGGDDNLLAHFNVSQGIAITLSPGDRVKVIIERS